MKMNAVQTEGKGVVAFQKWRRDTGISRSTAWRWRRNGWLTTFDINGRLFVDLGEVARFVAIAKSGRFAKRLNTPVRKAQRQEKPTAAVGGS
jgi:hypothetical protein